LVVAVAVAVALALAFAFVLAFAFALAFAFVLAFALAFAFLSVIPSAARNLLLARSAPVLHLAPEPPPFGSVSFSTQ
jgi:hypothetical protein